MERRLSVNLAAPRARRTNPLSPSRRVWHELVTASERPSVTNEPELNPFCNSLQSLPQPTMVATTASAV
jgi:hypothetical protein